MKKLFFIALIFATSTAMAQSYTIIHVIGKIKDETSGKYLTKGSKISESAKLKFETATAKAAALSSSRGRFVIQKNAQAASSGELVYALSSVLSPARGKLSTRAGGINNQMDFAKKFDEGPVAWLSQQYKVTVSSTAYPMDDNRFFYASYIYNNETINKKLDADGTSLVFDQATFFAIDGNAIDPNAVSEMQLFYYDVTKEESTMITKLTFAVVSKSDLQSVIESLEGIDETEKAEVVTDFINSLYGKCTFEEVSAAIKSL